jgi:Icc protein
MAMRRIAPNNSGEIRLDRGRHFTSSEVDISSFTMPGIFYRPLNRRQFLRSSTKAFAAGVLSHSFLNQPAQGSDPSLHLALLSDTHIAADQKSEYRKFVPWDNLKLVVAQVMEARPEAVLLDGDVARLTGEADDYRGAESLLKPLAEQSPIYLGLGNHDNRENFLKVFSAPNGTAQKIVDKHVLIIEEPFQRILLLDSLLYSNKTAGLLGKAQREWLDKYLASSDMRPHILFVHHTLGDGDGELLDAEALFRIVRPYHKVKAIFYGHSHVYAYAQSYGIHLINLPAVGYNFADKEPVGWVDARFSPSGVNLTLRAFGGNRSRDGQTTSLAWRS